MISQELIDKCKNPDRTAHKLLYEACAPYVYAMVKNYISNQSFRKDAMQEVFAHIFTSLDRFDSDKASFNTWIGRITINRCLALLRKKDILDLTVDVGVLEEIADSSFEYLDKLSKIEIESMLEAMPVGYRTVFLLSVIDGYNHKEIAEMLDITKETSRSQLSRAIAWIRKNIFPETKNNLHEAVL